MILGRAPGCHGSVCRVGELGMLLCALEMRVWVFEGFLDAVHGYRCGLRCRLRCDGMGGREVVLLMLRCRGDMIL